MFVGLAQVGTVLSVGSHEYHCAVGTGNPLMEMELTVIGLLPTFCIANAVTEVLFELTQAWTFVTLIDSACVLVWNILPPKKITPAPRMTEAMRIMRVVITFPIPLRFWNLDSILGLVR
jgi:hypothetical protein